MNENVIEIAWNKAEIVESYDKDKWRKDFAGAWIQRSQYGLRSEFGWMIDHVVPRSKGGSDEPSNLLPVHWRNNIIRADRYPVFKSGVTSKIKGRFFDPFCNDAIIRDKSRYNHICRDRRERNRVRVSTM